MATQARIDFITKHKAAAVAACTGTGLFPSLLLAQAILESSQLVGGVSVPGASVLSQKHHNYFGIKKAGLPAWSGPVCKVPTREVLNGKSVIIQAEFRSWPSVQEGFAGRNAFLKANPRYTKHGVFTATTAAEQAAAFQRAGYATDPNYAQLLTQILATYRQWLP